ncbi:His-Xaa-Ser system radical SAM maturase HxsC [Sphingomonas panacisoli]|nr:His-Xaa-Ser system radical SAM maturase HxsC [Sphingomonas panacisoli]
MIDADSMGASFAGAHGLFAIDGVSAEDLDGDVVLVTPLAGRAERLLRRASRHNTLLVTERCDQLCVMCSQPPKKTHVDRFALLEQACLLAEPDTLIGVSGGEPTLYKQKLLSMIEHVLDARPDVQFHILSNGQHFERDDVDRLRDPRYRRVSWGIPLYAADAATHDDVVGKHGAFVRLRDSFALLMAAGARVELRTVLLSTNVDKLHDLAHFVVARLRFIEAWSIMQLEHIGFAKGRWRDLFVRHDLNFTPVATALDAALLHGVRAQLFNFPLCTVPAAYRPYAIASISDWKNKTMAPCQQCSEREHCAGFFEWHPDEDAMAVVTPL